MTMPTIGRMRVAAPAMLVAIAFSASCRKQKIDDPRLEFSGLGFSLHLPPAMQQALDSLAPGFQTIRSTAFRSDVAQSAAEGAGGLPALFAVTGDFDGDGTQDAAVEGTKAGDSGLTVVAVLNGAHPRAMEVTRFAVFDADAVGIYLARPAAGRQGAFRVVNDPDATTVFSYKDGAFQGTSGR